MKAPVLSLGLLLATTIAAQQTQLVRGRVAKTPDLFVLACTDIRLYSTDLDLSQLVGQDLDLQIVRDGSIDPVALQVLYAKPSSRLFDMGDLRLGAPDRWAVVGPPGSTAAVWVTATWFTGYFPLAASGTWLLNSPFALVGSGAINKAGVFEFQFAAPKILDLIGVMFTAQAAYATPEGMLVISNPDCRTMQQN